MYPIYHKVFKFKVFFINQKVKALPINKRVIVMGILGIVMLLYITSVFATLTSVTLVNPPNNAYIRGTIIVNATVTGTASNASFYWSSDGVTWTSICTNTTSGNSFTCAWDTSSINQNLVQVLVNVTNATGTAVNDTNYGITVDNIAPVITNIKNVSIVEGSAVINWTTSENIPGEGSNSSVNYGTTLGLGTWNRTLSYVTSHTVPISPLNENTIYYYNVTSCDKAGNCNTTGPNNFSTLSIPPVITSIQASALTNSSSLITWTTNENANSTVNYGTTIGLGTYSFNTSNVTSHSINITGLINNTLYYYNVTSCDLAGNCNTTGPNSFTTLVDSTPPTVANLLVNSKTTVNITKYTKVNITVTVTDNTNVSSVWAYVLKPDNSTANLTMTNLSSTFYSVSYNSTLSGTYNVTAWARDIYGNVGSSSTRGWKSFGYYRVIPSVPSTFRNYSYGNLTTFEITIINEANQTETYTSNITMENYSHWNVSLNQTNLTLGTFGEGKFKVNLRTPYNASEYVPVHLNITTVSSVSGVTTTTIITLREPRMVMTLGDAPAILNTTYYIKNKTKWINFSGFTYSCEFDDLGSAPLPNITCGLWQMRANISYQELKGLYNYSRNSCLFNASGFKTDNYNFTMRLNDSRGHYYKNKTIAGIPNHTVVNVSPHTATNGLYFKLKGHATYNTGQNVFFGPISVNASYEYFGCVGPTLSTGRFELDCKAPDVPGNYTLNVSVKGVWNLTGWSVTNLKVINATNYSVSTEFVTLTLGEPSVTLTEGQNYTFFVSVKNNYSISKTFAFNVYELETRKHFDLEFNSSITISRNSSKDIPIKIIPYKYLKPGTYTLNISIAEERIHTTIEVNVPWKTLASEEINVHRYSEILGSTTYFTLNITNTKTVTVEFNTTETIPKSIAQNTSVINFNPQPNIIIQEDPVVMWILTLNPNESQIIDYNIPSQIKDALILNDVKIIDFYLPPGLVTPGEEVEARASEGDLKLLLIFIVLFITMTLIVVIIFKGEWLGVKKKPVPEFLREKEMGFKELK